MGIVAFTRARDRLRAADEAERPLREVNDEVVLAFEQVARFDGAAVMITDPDTSLPVCGVVKGFDPVLCEPFWDNELLDPDFNKFNQLARVSPPMATLAETIDGDLDRSPRFTKVYGRSIDDELRVAFVAGTTCLAVGVFARAAGDGPFTPEEMADVRELIPAATMVLRRALGRVDHATSAQPPVVLILDAAGAVRSVSAGGQRLLDDLRTQGAEETGLPSIVRVAATRARWSRNTSSLATRVQGRDGEWLRIHVTPMDDGEGSVAVTIEQARPGDLVPIMLESYGLTGRETDVVLYMARGLSTKEIAEELLISSHTVRDHIKSVYEKSQVTGRGELLARLFSEHVLDQFHTSVSHVP
ncbi:MAG: helix-turn-helix transcriptional regulator [Acidimicrobiales bacterium]|nr:helix-turn-helix transcriptional regulator [Acidimicrobiales bacterium]